MRQTILILGLVLVGSMSSANTIQIEVLPKLDQKTAIKEVIELEAAKQQVQDKITFLKRVLTAEQKKQLTEDLKIYRKCKFTCVK